MIDLISALIYTKYTCCPLLVIFHQHLYIELPSFLINLSCKFLWNWGVLKRISCLQVVLPTIWEPDKVHRCLKWLLASRKLLARWLFVSFMSLSSRSHTHINLRYWNSSWLYVPGNSYQTMSQEAWWCYCCLCFNRESWKGTRVEVCTSQSIRLCTAKQYTRLTRFVHDFMLPVWCIPFVYI